MLFERYSSCHYKLFVIVSIGCGKLWVVDGQWKLMFAHCMMQRKVIWNEIMHTEQLMAFLVVVFFF